jgi:hypothetical protein
LNAFTAFLLSVVQNFAVNTEFTISCGVEFGLIRVLLVQVLAIVEVGPVALASRSIAPVC